MYAPPAGLTPGRSELRKPRTALACGWSLHASQTPAESTTHVAPVGSLHASHRQSPVKQSRVPSSHGSRARASLRIKAVGLP